MTPSQHRATTAATDENMRDPLALAMLAAWLNVTVEQLLEKMVALNRADIRKYEDEALTIKERLACLYRQKSDLEYLLETVIEDSILDAEERTDDETA